MSSHPDEYGANRVDMTEPFEPLGTSATLPSMTTVYVAAGASITVLVIVTGDPTLFSPADEDEETEELVGGLLAGELVALAEALIMDAGTVCMHPFGEHTSSFGQHPPPISGEHSTRDARQCGG